MDTPHTTPEQDREISSLIAVISLLLAIRGVSRTVGICALSELLLIAYADMANQVDKEQVKTAFKSFIETMDKQGNLLIDEVAKTKRTTTSKELIDDIVKQFKGV